MIGTESNTFTGLAAVHPQAAQNQAAYANQQVPPVKRGVPRKIVIEPRFNGYEVRVGCQTLVFEKAADLVARLVEYLAAPLEVELRWRREGVHAELLDAPMAPAATEPGPMVGGQDCAAERQQLREARR